MRRLAAFLALPARDRMLLLSALSTLSMARAGLLLLPIRRVRTWATRPGAGTTAIDRLVWSVRIASRVAPGTTCLASALALQRLLARHGHASDLHIGVARNAQGFAAHAWLACDGRILVGEEWQKDYRPLTVWTSTSPS